MIGRLCLGNLGKEEQGAGEKNPQYERSKHKTPEIVGGAQNYRAAEPAHMAEHMRTPPRYAPHW